MFANSQTFRASRVAGATLVSRAPQCRCKDQIGVASLVLFIRRLIDKELLILMSAQILPCTYSVLAQIKLRMLMRRLLLASTPTFVVLLI